MPWPFTKKKKQERAETVADLKGRRDKALEEIKQIVDRSSARLRKEVDGATGSK